MLLQKEEAFEKLKQAGQTHLLQYWDELDPAERLNLHNSIKNLDVAVLAIQQSLVRSPYTNTLPFSPFHDYFHAGSKEYAQFGSQLIAKGMMGCLLIAGGQASRLRFDGPKGFFPVTIGRKKSLFQLFSEKVLAAGKQAGRPLLLAIMTSPLNHSEVVAYFHQNNFFGLNSTQVYFFSQKTLPCLDLEGNLFLEAPSKIAEGPNGNGQALYDFYHSNIWAQWHALGVRYLNFILIDNPLADPFDAELLGFHCCNKNEITIKCTPRSHICEKVGVLVKQGGACNVVEYSECPKDEWEALAPDNTLRHLCANLSLFCFNMDFIKEIAVHPSFKMPLHAANKAVKALGIHGKAILPEKPNAWKFEHFIFDVLPLSKRVKALLYPRERCFAALKNAVGPDSIETVHQALQSNDYQVYHRISGKAPPSRSFELAQNFHYPTPDLLRKWRGKELPLTVYIEP